MLLTGRGLGRAGQPQTGRGYRAATAGWQGSKRIRWENIPAGIRYAHGRRPDKKWDVDGCVGYPWGSLLTGKTTKYCGGFSFSQLQFRGQTGDPVEGTPVRMFPDCEDVVNLDDPANARCSKGKMG